MDIMDGNSSIFVQAKIEYTKQLINILKSHMYDGIKSIYEESKDLYKQNSSTSLLFIFRTLLEKIPEWNNEMVINETDRIIEYSKCDWLDELVTAVYISHTKILMSIGTNNGNKINLTVPKLINFIHKCYINIAREIWKNPLLFSEDISGYEYQQNINIIETIICDCIENTIRISLPVKEILKEHLDINDNGNNDSTDNNNKLLNELKELLLNRTNEDEEQDDIPEQTESENNKDKDKQTELVEPTKNQEQIDEKPINDAIIISNEEISDNLGGNEYKNEDGYISPDEETLTKKCENITINDIPDIKVDEIPKSTPVIEQKYDNVDIIDISAKENNEIYEKLIKLNENEELKESNPVLVSKLDGPIKVEPIKDGPIKVDPIKVDPIKVDPIFSAAEKFSREEEKRNYVGKIVDITEQENNIKKVDSVKDENKTNDKKELSYIEDIINNDKPIEKEIITVDKKGDDDKETVDFFYDDLKKISDKKGLTMEVVDETKYTLFDDL